MRLEALADSTKIDLCALELEDPPEFPEADLDEATCPSRWSTRSGTSSIRCRCCTRRSISAADLGERDFPSLGGEAHADHRAPTGIRGTGRKPTTEGNQLTDTPQNPPDDDLVAAELARIDRVEGYAAAAISAMPRLTTRRSRKRTWRRIRVGAIEVLQRHGILPAERYVGPGHPAQQVTRGRGR